MRHTYETSQWVAFPPEKVFAFFCDPANLPRLMPPWQQARIDHAFLAAPPLSLTPLNSAIQVASKGSVLTISFRAIPFIPIRLTWVAQISEFEWNRHFCDLQTRGPLAYWKHCHRISPETRDGLAGTIVTDQVTYALPLGPLGDIANAFAVRYQMKATFAFRQAKLPELLATR